MRRRAVWLLAVVAVLTASLIALGLGALLECVLNPGPWWGCVATD